MIKRKLTMIKRVVHLMTKSNVYFVAETAEIAEMAGIIGGSHLVQ